MFAGVRTRASLRAAAFSTQAPGGYWTQWERELRERRELWEEAQLRLKAQHMQQADEWTAIRKEWAAGAKQQQPKERVTWWWEGGDHRASPEEAAAFRKQFHGGGSDAPRRDPARTSSRAPGDSRGHYAAIGLVTAESRRADAEQVQAAFRRTVLDCHPDTAPKGAGNDEARTRRFRAAVSAWDVLRDKAQRERYDRAA